MRWSFQIARIADTSVQIHVTFFLLLAWVGGSYYLQGGMEAAITGTVFILLVFACVLLHEFGHALAARRYGIPTPTITLLPIGGVAQLQRMPEEPGEEMVVAAAGPLVNVVIAGALYLAVGGGADLSALAHLEEQHYGMMNKLLGVNVFLVLFNLIPAFPMDGGRMLRALLAMRMPYATATRAAATVGQTLAFGFGLMGLFGSPILLLIAVFVYFGAGQEAALVEFREATRDVVVEEVMLPAAPTFRGDESVDDAARTLAQSGHPAAALVDESGTPRGFVSRQVLFDALRRNNREATVESLASLDTPTLAKVGVLNDALELMQTEGYSALPVLDEEGELVGMLSVESIGEMLMLRNSTVRADDDVR